MKRRDFVKKLPVLTGAPLVLNSLPFNYLYGSSKLAKMAGASTNDKILVLIQLHGGNDGLNTVIPINQYSSYFSLRPGIAIKEEDTIKLDAKLPDGQQVGLHPAMTGFKKLYDEGYLNIVQNTGYERMSSSHFRGRNILFGGGGAGDHTDSGWIGRFLEHEFENIEAGIVYPDSFPNENMPDPLGLEFSGGDVALGFHTEEGIPAGITIQNPAHFLDLVNGLEGYKESFLNMLDARGLPPEITKGSLYEETLNWILKTETSTDAYARRLKGAYDKGGDASTSLPADYGGSIAEPLKVIARMIQGGCKTKVYLVRMGGFDTHANQLGGHENLLRNLSAAVYGFQQDLIKRGVADRVLGVTTSEFGRRARANASGGTDHGTTSPAFVFGKGVKGGVIGKNPDLGSVAGDNLSTNPKDLLDYRIILNTMLQDWFGVKESKVKEIILPTLGNINLSSEENYPTLDRGTLKIPLFANGVVLPPKHRFEITHFFPNPIRTTGKVIFYTQVARQVALRIYDRRGRMRKTLFEGYKTAGEHTITFDLTNLQSAWYFYTLESGDLKSTKQFRKFNP